MLYDRVERDNLNYTEYAVFSRIAMETAKSAVTITSCRLTTRFVYCELACQIGQALPMYLNYGFKLIATNVTPQLFSNCIDRLEGNYTALGAYTICTDQANFTYVRTDIHNHHAWYQNPI